MCVPPFVLERSASETSASALSCVLYYTCPPPGARLMCVEARTPMVGRNPRVSRPIASAWERVGSFTVVTDATAYCATGPYPAQQFMWEWTNLDSYLCAITLPIATINHCIFIHMDEEPERFNHPVHHTCERTASLHHRDIFCSIELGATCPVSESATKIRDAIAPRRGDVGVETRAPPWWWLSSIHPMKLLACPFRVV